MMKYVITDRGEFAIGQGAYHKDLASGFKGRVIAAGYCRFEGGEISVFGKSTGFEIAAQPEDAVRLAALLKEASRKHEG